jgi:hypothetical protein
MSQWRVILFGVLFLLLPAGARAESAYFAGSDPYILPNRLAMLVGVPAYKGMWAKLDNVNRDIPEVQKAFESLGFDSPRIVDADSAPDKWVTRALIYQHLYSFMEDARQAPGSIMVFYFAGHGFTHGGKMYLVPADAPIKYAEDPARFAIPLTDVIDIIKAGKPAVGIIVVDACRDLPFLQLSSFTDPTSRQAVEIGGFVDPSKLTYEDNQPNIGIIYAASNGEKALDGDAAGTSHFAAALVGAIGEAVQRVVQGTDGAPTTVNAQDVANDVIVRVREMTARKQNPRPELAFGYRLPLFSTERAFKAEEKAWKQLEEQTDLGTLARLYDKLDLKTAQARIYCLRLGFLRTYGYSYFWRQAEQLAKEVFSEEAAKQCLKTKQEVVASARGLRAPAVLAPSGDVSSRPPPSPTSTTVPDSPRAVTESAAAPTMPALERGLLADSLAPRANSRVVLVEPVMFDQPKYPGQPRKVPLNAGESVTFIQYVDVEHKTATVWHEKHGFGNLPTAALAVTEDAAVIRVALSFDAGQIDLSDEQQKVLDTQIGNAKAIKAISATIRFPKNDRTTGFRRAQAVASYLRRASALPVDRAADFVIPTIVELEELERGLVTLAIVIQTDVPTTATDTKVQMQRAQTAAPSASPAPASLANPVAVRVIDLQLTK